MDTTELAFQGGQPLVQGGEGREITSMQRAWFRCPRCQGDWEVRIEDDKVAVLPATEQGG